MEMDERGHILYYFIEDTYHVVVKVMCKTLYTQIKSAVDRMRINLKTKRARIEKTFQSPSDYGKQYGGNPNILDHRSSSFGLHVSIQVAAFGNFIDKMEMDENTIDSKYFTCATSLMQQMSGYYHCEEGRKNAFFLEVTKVLPQTTSVWKGRVVTDHSITVEDSGGQVYCVCNYELKNEFSGCTADAVKQNHGYFVQLQAQGTGKSPMLLISVIGCHYLQVFGATWYGDSVCIDPLCSPVSLLFVPRDPINGVAKVACVLNAIKDTIDELMEWYNCPDPISKGPYFNDNGKLTEVKRMKQVGLNWMFEAKHEGQEVVVKFARLNYGEEVHKYLGEQQLAPRLISCSQLPGGWCAVIMEKIYGSMLNSPVSAEVKTALKTAVEVMQVKNLVHGDLRPQNILVVGNKVRLLDFDWAGNEGTARYPKALNLRTGPWHSDVSPGGIVTKEHDLFQIWLL